MDYARHPVKPDRPSGPPKITPISAADLALINQVREALVERQIKPPNWRDLDAGARKKFFDQVRGVLIDSGQTQEANRMAQIVTDALSGVGLLDQLLRDPFVEEIFVRNGDVAVEYDGAFYYLGKLADDGYFQDLATHVADQGGATLRGDRPAVLVDLPGGERFTAIVPRLSILGTAINVRTFGRRVRTLEEMEQTGTFSRRKVHLSGSLEDIRDEESRARIASLESDPDRFLAWLVATMTGSLLIAGEMGSGKTTLLNALSGFLPKDSPVAVLETFRELDVQHPFLLRTVAPAELPEGQPGVTLDWVLNVIYTRMNPAVMLVGEVVAGEALQFLKATCLGRKAITTIHGGSVEEALVRLEQLALASAPELGLPAIRSMVALGLNVVALMGRVARPDPLAPWPAGQDGQDGQDWAAAAGGPGGNRVERTLQAITAIEGLDAAGNYKLRYLYRLEGARDATVMEQAFQRISGKNCEVVLP